MEDDCTGAQRRLLLALDRYQLTARAKEVCAQYHVTMPELVSGKRTQPIPKARAALWAWMKAEGLSCVRISEIFDVHNTTVLVAIRRHVARQP